MSEKNINELNANELEQVSGGANGGTYTTYTVVKGDNLSRIANRYHVTVNELVRWNNIKNPNLILPGQVLVIYQ